MVNADNGKGKEEEEGTDTTKAKGQIPFQVSSSQRALITHETSQGKPQETLAGLASPIRYLNFWQIATDKDLISQAVPSAGSHGFRGRLNDVFARKLDWVSLKKMCRTWIRDPMNMALLVWIICVAVSGAILFLVMTGMLNSALPKKRQREVWFEVNNQILNALFTLMCLYQHPKQIYHLILLCKWRPEDISKLRKIYCKGGAYKPHEWGHMMVVVLLLHLNCIAQYCLCGLNLGYKRSDRPPLGVGICISVSFGASAAAGLYSILSPLGKDYHAESDEESQKRILPSDGARLSQSRQKSLQKRYSFASQDEQNIVENRPEWKGGVLDFWDDISLAYLSLFCSFCVFGWNMERLGFGNMYVHIATFLLFCVAPFWIFVLAAVNIENETVREALVFTGIVLCLFGLFYGGFWRIQMRKRFNLPEYNSCCGNPAVTDCMLWLCCCWCSLAQEVRTGNAYDIVEDKFCRKQTDGITQLVPPSPHESVTVKLNSDPRSSYNFSSSPSASLPAYSESPCNVPSVSHIQDTTLSSVEEDSYSRGKDEALNPPTPATIQREFR